MNVTKSKSVILSAMLTAGMLVCSPTVYSQSGLLSKQQRTAIIDAILTQDLSKIRNLARRNPKLAPAIAALHAKHAGAKGKGAGEIAAALATAINADVDQASELIAAVSQSTTASLDEVAEITEEVANALGI